MHKWWQIKEFDDKTVLFLGKDSLEKLMGMIESDPPTDDRPGFEIVLNELGKELKSDSIEEEEANA